VEGSPPFDPTSFVTERLVSVEGDKGCPSGANVGAIVGGVLGGLVLLLLLLLLLFCLFRRGCFDACLTPTPSEKAAVPSAPPVENEYDALTELRKSKLVNGTGAFDNQAYGTGAPHVISGGGKGHYDNLQPAGDGIYDNTAGPSGGHNAGSNDQFDNQIYDNV
jgi:hypothetical protein